MDLPRSSGVLLHPTSLPGGRLGAAARAFVDWLGSAGQSWWQMLPLGPPDRTGSPYAALSAFAGSPALLEDPDAAVSAREVEAFRRREAAWVDEWSAYAGGDAVADQVRFDREWRALRRYAAERGVRLIGDVPIFVAPESADVAAHPELFRADLVAGVPPDYFSATGQLWGNPVYDWPALRRRGYRWWTDRFRRTLDLVDLARIDHFRGFVAYWGVPAGAATAVEGRWRNGPGRAVFRAAARELGDLPLIAEDLGVITPPVERLRDELGLPGTLVLQYAFSGGGRGLQAYGNHRERAVVYTGTHDHDTIAAWWSEVASDAERERADDVADRLDIREPEPHWRLLRLALASPARLAIVPLQDVLGLGNEARMNRPGTTQGNWRWRVDEGALTPALARRLRTVTAAAGRAPPGRRPSR